MHLFENLPVHIKNKFYLGIAFENLGKSLKYVGNGSPIQQKNVHV